MTLSFLDSLLSPMAGARMACWQPAIHVSTARAAADFREQTCGKTERWELSSLGICAAVTCYNFLSNHEELCIYTRNHLCYDELLTYIIAITRRFWPCSTNTNHHFTIKLAMNSPARERDRLASGFPLPPSPAPSPNGSVEKSRDEERRMEGTRDNPRDNLNELITRDNLRTRSDGLMTPWWFDG